MINTTKFGENIIQWFQVEGRNFPWRETNDAYKVLLAEKLLQQTSVRKNLIDTYLIIVDKYPTPAQLSDALIDDLKALIQPLGLHYRAKDLVFMAKDINLKFDGLVPSDLHLLLSLYGVGDYSARAVISFAFGKDIPVVDTNVARILYRVFNIPGKFPQNPARSRKLINLAQSLLPPGRSKEFNWGMIDLGSKVCLPKKPLCEECPLKNLCNYYSLFFVRQ
jgi:A/G-specific adenine glycosylase